MTGFRVDQTWTDGTVIRGDVLYETREIAEVVADLYHRRPGVMATVVEVNRDPNAGAEENKE